MRRVWVWVELPDGKYRAYESEGRRRGVPVEQLVQQTVQNLLLELQREERDGTDHPIMPS